MPTSAKLSYSWIRDSTRISGATGASYLVKPADAKHHLQCKVTATDAAGSASASSSFVAIPAQGVVAAAGETAVGRAVAEGAQLKLPVTCSALSVGACVLTLRVTVLETVQGAKVIAVTARKGSRQAPKPPPPTRHLTVMVGSLKTKLQPSEKGTLAVPLNGAGLALLAKMHRLPVQVTVSGTVLGSIKASLAHEIVTFQSTSHLAARGRRARR